MSKDKSYKSISEFIRLNAKYIEQNGNDQTDITNSRFNDLFVLETDSEDSGETIKTVYDMHYFSTNGYARHETMMLKLFLYLTGIQSTEVELVDIGDGIFAVAKKVFSYDSTKDEEYCFIPGNGFARINWMNVKYQEHYEEFYNKHIANNTFLHLILGKHHYLDTPKDSSCYVQFKCTDIDGFYPTGEFIPRSFSDFSITATKACEIENGINQIKEKFKDQAQIDSLNNLIANFAYYRHNNGFYQDFASIIFEYGPDSFETRFKIFKHFIQKIESIKHYYKKHSISHYSEPLEAKDPKKENDIICKAVFINVAFTSTLGYKDCYIFKEENQEDSHFIFRLDYNGSLNTSEINNFLEMLADEYDIKDEKAEGPRKVDNTVNVFSGTSSIKLTHEEVESIYNIMKQKGLEHPNRYDGTLFTWSKQLLYLSFTRAPHVAYETYLDIGTAIYNAGKFACNFTASALNTIANLFKSKEGKDNNGRGNTT